MPAHRFARQRSQIRVVGVDEQVEPALLDRSLATEGLNLGFVHIAGNSLAILLGWAVLLFGAAAIVIDLRSGSTTWWLTLGTLAFFGLLTAINVG